LWFVFHASSQPPCLQQAGLQNREGGIECKKDKYKSPLGFSQGGSEALGSKVCRLKASPCIQKKQRRGSSFDFENLKDKPPSKYFCQQEYFRNCGKSCRRVPIPPSTKRRGDFCFVGFKRKSPLGFSQGGSEVLQTKSLKIENKSLRTEKLKTGVHLSLS